MSPRRLVLWLALVVVATCLTNSSSLPDFDAWQRVLSQHVTAGVREGIHTNLVLLSTLPPLAHFPLLSGPFPTGLPGALPTAVWRTSHWLAWRISLVTSTCSVCEFPRLAVLPPPARPIPRPPSLTSQHFGVRPSTHVRCSTCRTQSALTCLSGDQWT
jgi:hypothetical protein